jgi:hypothetical protein
VLVLVLVLEWKRRSGLQRLHVGLMDIVTGSVVGHSIPNLRARARARFGCALSPHRPFAVSPCRLPAPGIAKKALSRYHRALGGTWG